MMTFYLHQNGRTHLNCFYKQIWEEEKWKKSCRKAYIKAKEKAMNFSSFTLDFQNSLSIVQYWKSSIQTTVILQQVSQLPKRKRRNSFDWPLHLPETIKKYEALIFETLSSPLILCSALIDEKGHYFSQCILFKRCVSCMQQGYHSITMWSNSSSTANFAKAEGSKNVPGVKIVHATGWPPMEKRGGRWCSVMPLALGFTLHLLLFKKLNLMGPIPRSRYRETIL